MVTTAGLTSCLDGLKREGQAPASLLYVVGNNGGSSGEWIAAPKQMRLKPKQADSEFAISRTNIQKRILYVELKSGFIRLYLRIIDRVVYRFYLGSAAFIFYMAQESCTYRHLRFYITSTALRRNFRTMHVGICEHPPLPTDLYRL